MIEKNTSDRLPLMLLISGLMILVWSGIAPLDRLTWLLEVLPAMIGAVILAATYRRMRLTSLVYVLIWVHALILIVGGHYTYAENPLFNWLRDTFGLARNYYDRLGHVAQGFIPAMIAREVLLRTSPLRPGKWLFFIVFAICMAVSAMYELIEWLSAVLLGEAADQFLAMQGDVWDTQWDMLLCGLGSLAALLTLGSRHNECLRRLEDSYN